MKNVFLGIFSMNKIQVICCLSLMLVAIFIYADQAAKAVLPKEVKSAQELLSGWVNKLQNNSSEQIVKQFGAPSVKSTWEFESKKEPLYTYNLTDKIDLDMYFLDNKVIKVSLQILSD